MMLYMAITSELSGVRQAPFQQQLGLFSPGILSPLRDSRMSRDRMNLVVYGYITRKVTLTKLGGYFQNKLLTM